MTPLSLSVLASSIIRPSFHNLMSSHPTFSIPDNDGVKNNIMPQTSDWGEGGSTPKNPRNPKWESLVVLGFFRKRCGKYFTVGKKTFIILKKNVLKNIWTIKIQKPPKNPIPKMGFHGSFGFFGVDPPPQITTSCSKHHITTSCPKHKITTSCSKHQIKTSCPKHQITTTRPKHHITTSWPKHQITTSCLQPQTSDYNIMPKTSDYNIMPKTSEITASYLKHEITTSCPCFT